MQLARLGYTGIPWTTTGQPGAPAAGGARATIPGPCGFTPCPAPAPAASAPRTVVTGPAVPRFMGPPIRPTATPGPLTTSPIALFTGGGSSGGFEAGGMSVTEQALIAAKKKQAQQGPGFWPGLLMVAAAVLAFGGGN